MNKKILIISSRFFPSIWWVEEQVKILWKWFQEEWYIVDILTRKFEKNLKKKEKVFWINVFRFDWIFWLIRFLIKNKDYKLIISRQYYRDSAILWVLKFLWILKSKTIICADSGWNNDEITIIKNKLKFLSLYKIYFYFISKNNYLNCLNNHNKKHLEEIYKNKQNILNKITKIYNWIKIEEIKNWRKIKVENILFLWRLEPEKGIFETIEAFKKIKNKNIKLYIIWYSDNSSIKDKLIESIKNDKRIFFLWKLYWDEKEKVLNKTDLFVFPTYYPEWQPVVLTEIILKNIPIISTDSWNNKEIYWDNITYTKKRDIIDLKNQIENIIDNIDLLNYNYSEAIEKIDIKNIIKQFLKL